MHSYFISNISEKEMERGIRVYQIVTAVSSPGSKLFTVYIVSWCVPKFC